MAVMVDPQEIAGPRTRLSAARVRLNPRRIAGAQAAALLIERMSVTSLTQERP
jgi:hypothetical protein